MKGKNKYLVLLILLLVICSGLVTYALFRTNKSGNATVNAARWNVVFKNGEEFISNNFNIQLSNATWTNPLGNVASGKIAPGSQATFYITIDATNTETDVDYTVELDKSFDESDFDVTLADDSGTIAYSTISGEMIRQIPIQVVWNGNINDDDNKNETDLLKRARNITIPIKVTAAQKLPLKYTVTFNDGAGNTISSKKVDEGSVVGTLPENPTRIGYTFDGWYDDPTNGSQVTAETIATSGMNIYAHWNIKYVTVTFDSDGGTGVASQQIQEGSTINPIPTTTKAGNDFLGWFDSSNNELTTLIQIMDDITYTARWYNEYSGAGELVYFDPVSDSLCNDQTFNLTNVNNGTSTCYKWRKIKEDDDGILVMLDHNIINKGAWSSQAVTADGPNSALSNLSTITLNWNNLTYLDYEYTPSSNATYGTISCVNGTCKVSNGNKIVATNVKARLITKEEIEKIGTSNSMWNENGYKTGNSYGSSNEGYWTLSPSGASSTYAWSSASSSINDGNISSSNGSYYGIRPVIYIPKRINLVFNFGNSMSNIVRTYNYLERLGQLPVPNVTSEDYSFIGWNTSASGYGTYVNENTLVSFRNLYAIYQYNNVENYEFNSNDTTTKSYVASKSGTYKLEVWGAQGGNVRNGSTITNGGYGGYTTSIVTLTQGDTLFITLGGHPDDIITSSTPSAYIDGGYNGGGRGIGCSGTTCGASGGGATHIALNSGLLTTFSSNENRPNLLIVAAGGGGAGHENVGYVGGSAGGYVGSTGTSRSGGNPSAQAGQGGTQSSGGYGAPYGSTGGYSGTFGKGADAGNTATNSWAGAGGGAGLYGGGSGNAYGASGGGGSSYTKSTLNNKAMYCYNCTENGDSNTYTISTYGTTTHENERDTSSCPYGYSDNPISKCAKSGNGYARITYLGE